MSKLKPWKQIQAKTVFESPYLNVVEDTVELPTGKQIKWFRFDNVPDGVSIILKNDEGRILLARQYCHPGRHMVWEFPGGRCEENEKVEATARREAEEEVGVYPQTLEKLGRFLQNARRSAHYIHVFLGTDLDMRPSSPEPAEFIEWAWYTEQEIDAMIRQGEIEEVILLASWALYKNRTRDMKGEHTS